MKLKWVKRLVLAFLFVIAVLLGVFEVAKRRFDPELYRAQIIGYIKDKYGVEADFYRIHYELTTRLSVVIEAPRLKGEDVTFSASSVEISPSLRALLGGKFVVKNVVVLNPITLLHRYGDGTWNFQKLLPMQGELEDNAAIIPNSITVINGTVAFIDELLPSGTVDMHLTSLNFGFRMGNLFKPPSINLTAKLKGKVRPATLNIELTMNARPSSIGWKDIPLDGRLVLNSVDPAIFKAYLKAHIPEQYMNKLYSFELDISGVPSGKLVFGGLISAHPATAELRPGGQIDDQRFEVIGSLTGESLVFDDISIFMPEITLNGTLEISGYRNPDPNIRLKFSTPFTEISRLGELAPPGYKREPLVKFVEENIKSGEFKLTDISFEGSYSSFTSLDDPGNFNLVSGKVELKDFSFEHKKLDYHVDGINGVVSFDGKTFSFSGVQARHGKSILKMLAGRIDSIHDNPTMTVGGLVDVDVEDFHKKLLKNIASRELLKIFSPVKDSSGNMVLKFEVVMDMQKAEVTSFYGDLAMNNVAFKHALFELPVKKLNGRLTMNRFDIKVENASWITGSSTFETSGVIKNYSKPEYNIDMTFKAAGEPSQFAKTRFYNLDFIKHIKGKVATVLHVSGRMDSLSFNHTMDLTDAEYEAWKFLKKQSGAPLHVNSRGRLSGMNRLVLDSAVLKTGNSSVLISGKVGDVTTFSDYELDVRIKRFDIDDMHGFSPDFYKGGSNGNVAGQFNVVRSKGKNLFNYHFNLELKDFDLKQVSGSGSPFEQMNFTGRVNGSLEISGKSNQWPSINGKINGKGVGGKTPLVKPFYGLDGTLFLKGNEVRFSDITGNIGSSWGKVSGTITLAKEPVMRLNFRGDTLHLEDMFVASEDEKKRGRKGKEEEKESVIHAQWYLNIKSKKGTLGEMDYKDLTTVFTYYKDKYNFGKLDFVSNQGKWKLDGTLNTEGDKRVFEGGLEVTGLDFESFLEQMWPENSKIAGKLDVKGKFSGDGLTWNSARKNLDGQMEYHAKSGRLKNYQAISDIFSIINIAPIFSSREEDQKGVGLPFKSINGRLAIKDGVGHTDDMELDGNVVRMSIVGDFDFGKSVVDLKVGVKPFTTVDKIVSSIPIAGRLLTGKEKSLLVSYYSIDGDMNDPKAEAITVKSIGRNIFGIFVRILELPGTVLENGSGNDENKNGETKPPPPANDNSDEGVPPSMQ
ncbi:MAG: AsmA-like C-terminal domain-containing protein [Nitrospinota bacterium]